MAILHLHEVSKKYQMGRVFVPAVKNLHFDIEKGEFAAISGPSGSGKSTTLNLIGLVDLPSSGQIILDGIDVYKDIVLPDGNNIPLKLDRRLTELRASHLGFIFQNFNLIPVLNVYDNVDLPLNLLAKSSRLKMTRSERADWVHYLIRMVGLEALESHKPSELSGGQRQRVAIARALVTKAPLILADEPTANLDSKTGAQILELMCKLNEELQTTFLFSTHDAHIVEMCNHVIYILDGEQVNEVHR